MKRGVYGGHTVTAQLWIPFRVRKQHFPLSLSLSQLANAVFTLSYSQLCPVQVHTSLTADTANILAALPSLPKLDEGCMHYSKGQPLISLGQSPNRYFSSTSQQSPLHRERSISGSVGFCHTLPLPTPPPFFFF